MVADDLGNERQTETGAILLSRNKRVEHMLTHVVGNPVTIVGDAQREFGSEHAIRCALRGDSSCPGGRRFRISAPVSRTLSIASQAFLARLKHHLHELIAVALNLRQ